MQMQIVLCLLIGDRVSIKDKVKEAKEDQLQLSTPTSTKTKVQED